MRCFSQAIVLRVREEVLRARAIVLHARALSSSARARYRSPRVCALVLRARHHSPRARYRSALSVGALLRSARARFVQKIVYTSRFVRVILGHALLLCIVSILTDDHRREFAVPKSISVSILEIKIKVLQCPACKFL